jgi:hypothetical protein
MDGIVGGVQIQDDLPGRLAAVGLQEQIDEQGFDGRAVMADLVIAAGLGPGSDVRGQLQPVQGALARHRRAVGAPGLELARQDRHHRVMAQVVVVVQVFIPQGQPKYPLAHQGGDVVLDKAGPPGVVEAPRQPSNQADRPVRRPQQQRPRIRRHRPAVKRGHHLAAIHACKTKQIQVTLCRHRGVPAFCAKTFSQNTFLRIYAPMHLIR